MADPDTFHVEPDTFAGARAPDVARLLKLAASMSDQADHVRGSVLRASAPTPTERPPERRMAEGGVVDAPSSSGWLEALKGVPDSLKAQIIDPIVGAYHGLGHWAHDPEGFYRQMGEGELRALKGMGSAALQNYNDLVAPPLSYEDQVARLDRVKQRVGSGVDSVKAMTPRQRVAAGTTALASLLPLGMPEKAAAAVGEASAGSKLADIAKEVAAAPPRRKISTYSDEYFPGDDEQPPPSYKPGHISDEYFPSEDNDASPGLAHPTPPPPEGAPAGPAPPYKPSHISDDYYPGDDDPGALLQGDIAADPAGARARYAALNDPKIADTKGGKLLNTDMARELSPEYQADRSLSAEVHEPASQFVKDMYAEKLQEAPKPGERNSVLFTAGGTGAGKSSALESLPKMKNLADKAQIIYDTNMNTYASAKQKVQAALDAGKKVNIAYVYRDPTEAFTEGTLKRAMRMGRTVPIQNHIDTHAGSMRTIAQLQDDYASNPNVQFHIIDNSNGPGKAKVSTLDRVSQKRYDVSAQELQDATDKQYREGKISDTVYRGITGRDPGAEGASGVAGVVKPAEPSAGGQPQPEAGGQGFVNTPANGPERGGAELLHGQPRGVDMSGKSGSVIKQLADKFDSAIANYQSLGPQQQVLASNDAAKRVAKYFGAKDGSPRPLLSKNLKLAKGEGGVEGGQKVTLPDGRGVEFTGLSLAPAYKEGKFSMCPNATNCVGPCLGKGSGGNAMFGGGRDNSAFKGPRLDYLNRTNAMLADPEAFAIKLNDEITKAKQVAASHGNALGVRLNVLSDINPRVHEAIIKAHPDVQFYDYTKNNTDPIAPNHHYTYSSKGVAQPSSVTGLGHDIPNPDQNWKQMRRRLDTGSNVAMAFTVKKGKPLPLTVTDQETGKIYKVVDGDPHDFRPLDAQPQGADGVIVGLRNKEGRYAEKGSAERTDGFLVHFDPKAAKDRKTGKVTYGNTNVDIAPQTSNLPQPVKKARGGVVEAPKGKGNKAMSEADYLQQFHNHHHYIEHEDDSDADDKGGAPAKLAALRENAARLKR